jgi:predicted permease
MRELLRKIGYYLRRRRFEAELEEEMAYHRELSGERRFGNAARLKEESRAVWGWPTLDSAARDLRYGARRLLRSPGFTTVALLSLGLGIGANTAIFQLVNAVRLRSLPVPDPQELVEIAIAGGNGGFGRNTGWNSLTFPIWEQIRDNQQAFEGAFAWARTEMELGEGDATRTAQGAWVSGETFTTLGVAAFRGRMIGPDDDRPGCPATAVVSHGLWQRDLGGRDTAVGSEITVRGRPVTVIGVASPEFFGIEVGRRVEVFMPFCVIGPWSPGLQQARNLFWLGSMGRLRPGWTAQGAAAHLAALSGEWLAAVAPDGYGASWMERWDRFRLTALARPNGISVVRETYGASLWLLLGITGLVLLIACANLANLMLARSTERRLEMAVRMAIGASRARVLWQLFWESLILALGGAALGVALATLLSDGLLGFIRSQAAFVDLDVPVDWRVLAFVGASALLICLALALSTGFLVTRDGRSARIATASRDGQSDRRGLVVQRPLIALQVAVSLVLIVSSLVFVRSFRNLFTMDAGFRQEGIVYHYLDFGSAAEDIPPLLREALASARQAPGVDAAATSTHLPLSGNSFWLAVRTEGAEESPAFFTWVSPGYFETVEIPTLAGRDFTDSDDAAAGRVLLVNEMFVRRHFDGADPVGRTVRSLAEPGYPAAEYQVVGVVADTRYSGLREEIPPIAYAPAAQIPDPGRNPMVVTRSRLPATEVAAAVEAAVARVAPAARIDEVVDIRAQAVGRMARERMLAWIAGFFGVLALSLAAIGLYGVVAFVVEGRRAEIGIRMALGASRAGVAWMVLRQIAALLGIGLVLGTVMVLTLSSAAQSLLVDVESNDPLMIVAAAALLFAVGAWAALVPARRAARIDPRGILG